MQQGTLDQRRLAARQLQLEAAQKEPLTRRLFEFLCFMPSDRHESAFWGHLVIYVVFFVWGWYFILHGIDYVILGTSFLHMVNLPFHEYGHVVFSVFGEWWGVLGGSLFQIILPLFPLSYWVIWHRDNFPASIMLWWCGQNFLDVAVYIEDAQVRALPLVGGEGATHDWFYILSTTGSLDSASVIATVFYLLGVAVLMISNIWGGFLLYVEFRGRTSPESATGDV